MSKLIAVVGVSGVGKTTLVRALAKAFPFQTAYEGHAERPFQALFKEDRRYALANQIDYLLVCAEQEKELRASSRIGLMDGGLDLDFHGFTRLFNSRGMLTQAEFDLCRRVYQFLRETLAPPELFVHLCADAGTIANRLSRRDRINIARAEDTALFNSFLEEWLGSIPSEQVLKLNVSREAPDYKQSVENILRYLRASSTFSAIIDNWSSS
jgi:deoxyadenosine/deoxycytidine kinase